MTGASGNHSISLSLGLALYLALAFGDWGLATCQVWWGVVGGSSGPGALSLPLTTWCFALGNEAL